MRSHIISFFGELTSGHVQFINERIYLRTWPNGSRYGDGQGQEISIDLALLPKFKEAIERMCELYL